MLPRKYHCFWRLWNCFWCRRALPLVEISQMCIKLIQKSAMPLRAFLNRCRTKPLVLATLGLCSCGSGFHSLPLGDLGSSVAMIYSIDSVNHRVLRYTPNDLGTATLVSDISLPAGMTATLVTTDAAGNVYVGGYTMSANRSEVVVYDAEATDDDAPMRTLKLHPGKLIALAVDRQSEIYAAQKSPRAAVYVYSSIADEVSPIRTIEATSFVDINDLAVDSTGNVYVSGWNGSASLIREFSSTAAGSSTTVRTLWAPHGATFGGLAVDDGGNIFAMQDHTIYEFAAGAEFASGAKGTPQPIQAINLPAQFVPYASEAFSNVLRRDGVGNFFVPVKMTGANANESLNMVYGFASNADGDATPILQFTADDATGSGPHGHNIPLAVF